MAKSARVTAADRDRRFARKARIATKTARVRREAKRESYALRRGV